MISQLPSHRYSFILILCLFFLPRLGRTQEIPDFFELIESHKTALAQTEDKDPEEQITLLKSIGAGYHQLGLFDSALHYYNSGLLHSEISKYPELYSSIVYNLSLVYFSQGSYEQALDYALLSLKTDREIGKKEDIAASLNSVSLIYQEWGFYDKALEYRLEAIRYSEASGNKVDLANSHYNLGNLYLKTGKTDIALEYFHLASEQYSELLAIDQEDIGIRKTLSETVYSIGGIHLYDKDYSKALNSFETALQTKTEIGDKIGMANCYYSIGLTHIQLNNYSIAEQNLLTAFEIKNEVNDKKGTALASFRIGEVNLKLNRFEKAATFLTKSIDISKEIGDKEILREDYKLLYELFQSTGNPGKALEYHVLFKAYTDSLNDENTRKIVEELGVRYETDRKEKEIEIQELTIQRQKSLGKYLIGIIALVLLILVILFLMYRSKQKTNRIISGKNSQLEEQNIQIAEQKELIERKNQDLTDSIVYAKRIQDSMLEEVEVLNRNLRDAFIFFKPKDIVSGDFYWFGKKDDKFIISAIDCTGHGVPGAFMSMLGNTYLNQIVHNQGITSPEDILTALSKEVQIGLKQAETNNQDGMDMALCTISMDNAVVEYAGAKNPLVYICDGEAVRLKADRLPIGISYAEDETFHKHRIEVRSSTCFYMFSDGYPDQFGGEGGGKFMTKRLQKLLLEIHKEPMNKQKEILETTLKDWMKDEEQVDDIIVVGFHLP